MKAFAYSLMAGEGCEALGYTVKFSKLKRNTHKMINSGSRSDARPKLIVYWAHVTHSNVTLSQACSGFYGQSSKSGCQSSSEVNGRAKEVQFDETGTGMYKRSSLLYYDVLHRLIYLVHGNV